MKINELPKIMGRSLVTIRPNDTIDAAIHKLVEHRIGSLPVCDSKGTLLGIVTERDLLRGCSQSGTSNHSVKVKDIMTKEVVIGILDDDINYVMEVMTSKQIRHLPIMVGKRVSAMISARDIVEYQLEQSRAKVRYLGDYLELVSAVLQMDMEDTL